MHVVYLLNPDLSRILPGSLPHILRVFEKGIDLVTVESTLNKGVKAWP